MDDPGRYYTPELQSLTREKIRKIGCPILIARGDVHAINKLNDEIVVPELKAAGKQVEVIVYPGERHGFSNSGTPQATLKFFNDADAFFRRYLATRPTPVEASLVQQVPVVRP
jgi:dienelactone hydrolase